MKILSHIKKILSHIKEALSHIEKAQVMASLMLSQLSHIESNYYVGRQEKVIARNNNNNNPVWLVDFGERTLGHQQRGESA